MITVRRKRASQQITGMSPSDGTLLFATCFGLAILALCLGLLTSRSYAPLLIAIFVVCGVFLWISPRPDALPVAMLGVLLLPTPAMADKFRGVPTSLALGLITVGAALLLWWHHRPRDGSPALSPYPLLALVILVFFSLAQLAFSHYARVQPIYDIALFWIAGLFLGATLARDPRMTDRLGLLALALAIFAVIEFAISRPNLWEYLVEATAYDKIGEPSSGAVQASSTFGHPLIAGMALVIMAFIVFARPGRKRTVLFALIVAGAGATVSRSALVGLAAGLLTLLVLGGRERSHIVGAIAAIAVVGWLTITFVPALNASFTSRVFGTTLESENIRVNSLHLLKESLTQGDPELIAGRGLGGSQLYLAETKSNLGFGVYDNQYVTALYDTGVVVALVVAGLIIVGIVDARPSGRALAPFVAAVAAMLFVDGLYWPIIGLLFWMTVGLATSPRAWYEPTGNPAKQGAFRRHGSQVALGEGRRPAGALQMHVDRA